MSATFVDQGNVDLLTLIKENQADFRVGLYTAVSGGITNNTVLSDVTEATYSGYASQTPSFAAASEVSDQGSMAASDLTFTHNGGGTGNTILGAFLKRVSTSKLWAIEAFAAAKTMAAGGDSIVVSNSFLSDQF